MLGRKLTTWITAGLVLLLLQGMALAQAVNNAQIRGVIADPSGAVIPGATVVATSASTGSVHSTVSGADGTYVLADLQIGGYTIEVTATGFNKYRQTGIVLQVGQNVQVNIS